MTHVRQDDDLYYQGVLYAWDGSDYVPVQVNASGHLIVDQETDPSTVAQNYGYVGGAWQKDPIRFGPSDTVSEKKYEMDLPGGSSSLLGTAVPTGEVHVITQASILYLGTSPTNIDIRANIGGVDIIITRQPSPVSNVMYDRQGWWVLAAGDYMKAAVDGATLHDNLYLWYSGFKIDVDL